MLEGKETVNGKKKNPTKVFEAIALKFNNKNADSIAVKWKNLKKRSKEKQNKIASLRNQTGGGGLPASCPQLNTPEKRVLSIVKAAEPLVGVTDSNL